MRHLKKLSAVLGLLIIAGKALAQESKVTNPILAGFYPDPSICRAGKDYYLVNSTFSYYPGLPIFHSTDLVNWKQVGFAMDRPEQLNLDSLPVSLGLFAPAIRYNKGIFYITCTLVGKGGNFVITARNPKGPWSNPVWLPAVKGIDPSLFFDDDGKLYIVHNSEAPDNKPQYQGHCTIRLHELDINTFQVKGEEKILVNGGTDISKKPIWIEGPHLYKYKGYYYLLCAEGGTGYDHSEVVFRSKKVDGPYESYAGNPVLTQRTLDVNRKRPITSTGHADMVAAADGNWYAVFLGCRPYKDDHYNTGRETYFSTVQWKDGWPVIVPNGEPVPATVSVPGSEKSNGEFGSNYFFKDDFKSPDLNNRYQFLRTVRTPWYHINNVTGTLTLQLQPITCSDKGNPSFIGYRQSHLNGYAATAVTFKPAGENEKAGLIVFQNDQHFYYLCQSVENNQPVVALYRGPGNDNAGKQPELVIRQKLPAVLHEPLQLKIQASGSSYAFYYGVKPGHWQLLKDNVPAYLLSTHTAGGFVGCMYALYATSNGIPSNNTAAFTMFESKGSD
jgi:alpha-N-arabinofuranosidase